MRLRAAGAAGASSEVTTADTTSLYYFTTQQRGDNNVHTPGPGPRARLDRCFCGVLDAGDCYVAQKYLLRITSQHLYESCEWRRQHASETSRGKRGQIHTPVHPHTHAYMQVCVCMRVTNMPARE